MELQSLDKLLLYLWIRNGSLGWTKPINKQNRYYLSAKNREKMVTDDKLGSGEPAQAAIHPETVAILYQR